MPPGLRANFESKLVAAEPMRVYFTGKTLHATAGSRVAHTDELVKGAVVCFDPYGHDEGQGIDVTQPEDGAQGDNIGMIAGVVEKFDTATGPQWITIIPAVQGTVCNALVKANASVATPTVLTAVTGEFHLVAATITGGAVTLKEVFDPCARALETADTSSTAANKPVLWK